MYINTIAGERLVSTNAWRPEYRETALKLQKEWNVEDPQLFDFAPHVRENALVAVLHRGLLYHDSERKCSEVCLESRLTITNSHGLGMLTFSRFDAALRPHCLDFSALWLLRCRLRQEQTGMSMKMSENVRLIHGSLKYEMDRQQNASNSVMATKMAST